MIYDIIYDIMTSGSLCSTAALGSPCRCSSLTATLPRLCRPDPALADTRPPDPSASAMDTILGLPRAGTEHSQALCMISYMIS